ncbi:unnamed protein product [Calypogeia fissa]
MGGALAMAASLVMFQWKTFCEAVVRSLLLAISVFMGSIKKQQQEGTGTEKMEEEEESFAIYEGVVWHERRHPIHHQFEYKVRYAFVNLDKVPSWFSASAQHHMTAGKVRSIVGTSGPVYLLCIPKSVGYEQNPISVYYCYDNDAGGPHGSLTLSKTIAEVTNTPWGERVTFTFASKDDGVPKPLHVSPFMDMEGTWRLHAPAPGERLFLTVGVEHPQFGNYFLATLRAKKVDPGQSPEWFLWLMPHKVAVWIYWQALVLLWKGVAFVQHPKYVDGNLYKARAQDRDGQVRLKRVAGEQVAGSGVASVSCPPRLCKWQEAAGYPWL